MMLTRLRRPELEDDHRDQAADGSRAITWGMLKNKV